MTSQIHLAEVCVLEEVAIEETPKTGERPSLLVTEDEREGMESWGVLGADSDRQYLFPPCTSAMNGVLLGHRA